MNEPQRMPELPPTANYMCQKPECGTTLTIPIPRPRIFNHQDVSSITFAHQRLDKCPNCGTHYLFQVGGINEHGQILLTWLPVEVKNQPSIVEGSDQSLKSALAAQNLVTRIKQ